MVEELDLSCTLAVRARERLTELALRHEPTAGGRRPDASCAPSGAPGSFAVRRRSGGPFPERVRGRLGKRPGRRGRGHPRPRRNGRTRRPEALPYRGCRLSRTPFHVAGRATLQRSTPGESHRGLLLLIANVGKEGRGSVGWSSIGARRPNRAGAGAASLRPLSLPLFTQVRGNRNLGTSPKQNFSALRSAYQLGAEVERCTDERHTQHHAEQHL
jgi:hypothetical protein